MSDSMNEENSLRLIFDCKPMLSSVTFVQKKKSVSMKWFLEEQLRFVFDFSFPK